MWLAAAVLAVVAAAALDLVEDHVEARADALAQDWTEDIQNKRCRQAVKGVADEFELVVLAGALALALAQDVADELELVVLAGALALALALALSLIHI